MEITEERALAALPVHQTEEIGEQRVGKFLRIRSVAAGLGDCSGGRAQIASIFLYKIFPGGFGTFDAGRGQGQILYVQRKEILFQPVRGGRTFLEPFVQGALESANEWGFGE